MDELLPRVARGEPAAVEACLTRYERLVWTLARRMLPTVSEAEDAVQEIFIELWQCAGRFDPRVASEPTFVAMIARRRLIDRRRRSSRSMTSESLSHDRAPEPAAPALMDVLETGDEARRARQALEELRPEQQEVLRLSIFDGWPHARIAEHLNLPLGTVKTHLRRGLLRVREALSAASMQEAAP